MIDIQLFVGCATCGWQQGCPREDLPISIPPTPFSRGRSGPSGFPSPPGFPCPPTPARHLMMPCSALEGVACEAGGPGPRGGFLLPHMLSLQRLPCPPTPARHLMTYLNPPNPLFKGAIRAYGLSIATGFHCPPSPARHLLMPC